MWLAQQTWVQHCQRAREQQKGRSCVAAAAAAAEAGGTDRRCRGCQWSAELPQLLPARRYLHTSDSMKGHVREGERGSARKAVACLQTTPAAGTLLPAHSRQSTILPGLQRCSPNIPDPRLHPLTPPTSTAARHMLTQPLHPPSEFIFMFIAATSQSKRRAYSVLAKASRDSAAAAAMWGSRSAKEGGGCT